MTLKNIKYVLLSLIAACALVFTGSARADATSKAADARAAREDIKKTLGFVPSFFNAFGDSALPGTWQEMKGLQLNPKTALSGRIKELIGLGVAAQVPCRYCIYAHVEFAKLNGASDTELNEAVAVAAAERHWSTILWGRQVDEARLRADVARLLGPRKPPSGAAIVVTDGRTALDDIQRTFGFVPELLRAVPEQALPGAWREMKDLKLDSSTQLSAKNKALIALAVASQVPSRPCVIAETEFAKAGGANDAEIAEAVGMAAITRNMSTLLNGLQVDEAVFRGDVEKLVAGAKAAAKKSAAKPTALR
ncbi:MAG TPA: carboxymuconolactone decarboxylase family protein [Polyangiaceae bacterium]|nr:carboxymuconolactone decarboxylase family protein [Polyangiaceae bacterium]